MKTRIKHVMVAFFVGLAISCLTLFTGSGCGFQDKQETVGLLVMIAGHEFAKDHAGAVEKFKGYCNDVIDADVDALAQEAMYKLYSDLIGNFADPYTIKCVKRILAINGIDIPAYDLNLDFFKKLPVDQVKGIATAFKEGLDSVIIL